MADTMIKPEEQHNAGWVDSISPTGRSTSLAVRAQQRAVASRHQRSKRLENFYRAVHWSKPLPSSFWTSNYVCLSNRGY